MTPLEAQAFLLHQAERAARTRATLEHVEETAEWDEEMISVYGRIALEYGLRMSATQEEWARWAADEVTSAKAKRASELARKQHEGGRQKEGQGKKGPEKEDRQNEAE